MLIRHTPPPLSRGEIKMLFFLLIMSALYCGGFPSREGIKGCVTVRSAVWFEKIFLLFGEEVFLDFGWILLI